jgi:hypothetical protein
MHDRKYRVEYRLLVLFSKKRNENIKMSQKFFYATSHPNFFIFTFTFYFSKEILTFFSTKDIRDPARLYLIKSSIHNSDLLDSSCSY